MKNSVHAVIIPLVSAILLLTAAGADAEHIFLKDGRIFDGKVAVENDAIITLVLGDGSRKTFARREILRMLYSDEYKTKLVIRLTNGDEFEGFIVNETREDYTIRKKLNDTGEQVISKERVTYTAKKRPSELAARPTSRGVELTWSKPLGSFKKFIVYAKKKKDPEYKAIDETWRTTTTVGDLEPDTLYAFIVRVVDNDNYESTPSNEVTAKTLKTGEKEAEPSKKEKAQKEKAAEKERELLKKAPAPAGADTANVGISVRPSVIVPILDFKDSADIGAGGLVGIDWLHVGGSGFKMGLHAGAWYLFPKGGTTNHIIAPITLRFSYEISLAPWFRLAPALDAGYSYSAMSYSFANPVTALLIGVPLKTKKSVTAFNPIGMVGVQFLFLPTGLVGIGINAQYGIIFEKSGLLHMVALSADVTFRF